jgi:hypothetical protein
LHSLLDPAKAGSPFRERQISIDPKHKFFASDTAPKFFVRPQPYGLRIGARRVASEEEYYWRITQFLAPFFTMIAPGHESNLLIGHAWTPIDDNNCWTFTFFWDRDNPLKDRGQFDSTEIDVPVQNDGSYRPICNQKNNYGIDRDIQRLHTTTGIKGIGLQDSAIQESMGPIVDRSKEHLASSDSAIVAFRKLLLTQARQLRKTGELDLAKKPELYKVRSAGIILPKELDFEEVTRRSMAIS